MLFKKIPFFYFLIFFAGVCLDAQTPLMRHITDEQGLPSMAVYDVMEDKKGYIWMATDKGLYKYDGIFFKQYASKNTRGSALSFLQEDTHGRVWGVTFAGQICHTEGDSLVPFLPFDKDFKGNIPSFVVIDNEIWVASYLNNLLCYNLTTLERDTAIFKKTFISSSRIPLSTWYINKDDSNNIYYFDNDKKEIKYFSKYSPNMIHSASYNKHKSRGFLSTTNNRTFYFDTNLDYELLDIKELIDGHLVDNNFKNYPKYIKTRVNNILAEDNGDIWIATYRGVFHFDKKGNLIHHLLPDKTVGNIIKDKEGMYWLCTPLDGVYVIPNMQMTVLDARDGIVRLAYDGTNHIYMGATSNKFLVFNPKLNKIVATKYLKEHKDFQQFSWLNGKYPGLYFVSDYMYRITSPENGFKKEMKTYGMPVAKESICVDSANLSRIYMASSMGAIRWSMDNSTVISYDGRRFSHVRYNAFSKEVWYSGADYFLIVDEKNKTKELKMPFNILDFSITDNGDVWIATDRSGLVLYKNNNIVKVFNEKNGLLGNRVIKILADKNNIFWLSTDGGIQRLDANNSSFLNITKANNLLGNTIYDMTLTDNDIWLATSKGVQYFPKDIALYPSVKPLLYIDSVKVGSKVLNINNDNSISLSQNDANIRIKFTGLSFYSGQNFKYRYRVKELDSAWIYTVPETNYALFQSLPSGKYTFQVQLVTDDNRTSDVVSLPLSISPILWRQWWFYAIMSLGASFGIFVYFKSIIRKMKERDIYFRKAVNADLEKTRAEEAYRRAQLSALKAQMNPHFLFNALNSIQAFIFLNDKNSANTYLGKFSDLMRLTLDMSQKETVSLHDEIQMLEHYLNLEAMRLRNDLKWHIKTDTNINVDSIQIPPLLIQPYVENAIKHGLAPKKEERTLSVFFCQKDNQSIICEITDNGIGRQKALELKKLRLFNHKSFSTSATEQRLNLLNTGRADKIMVQYEDLVAPDGSVLGTKAIVIIPLS